MKLGEKFLNIAKKNGINISNINPQQLLIGFSIELEHGSENDDTNITNDNILSTIKIAIAHLRENPDYYTLLKKYVETDTKNDLINENKRFKELIGFSLKENKKILSKDF